MLSKKLLFLVGSLLVGFNCKAMEEQQQNMVTIQCGDGEIHVQEQFAKQAHIVKELLEEYEGELDSVNLESFCPNKTMVWQVFECIRDKKNIKKLKFYQINDIFEVADAIGVPQWCLRKLTLHGKEKLAQESQHPKIACGHYLNSIRSLHNEKRSKDKLENIEFNDEYHIVTGCTLNLCKNKLDSLKGIEILGEKYKKVFVTELNVEHNKLETLNVAQLFEVFPELRRIRACNNHISKLELPKRLPDNVFLNLGKNRITELPDFKVGENGFVQLRGNQLSKQARLTALNAMKLTLLEGQRHRVKAITDKNTLKAGLTAGIKWLPTGLISVGAGAGIGMLYSIIKDPNFSYRIIPLLIKRYDVLIEHIANEYADTYKDPTVIFTVLGLASLMALFGCYCEYDEYSYNNNLIHQFKPGTVLLDEEKQENKE